MFVLLIIFLNVFCNIEARKHTLEITDDMRHSIMCDSFGYDTGGSLYVNVTGISSKPEAIHLALAKTSNAGLASYAENKLDSCEQSTTTDIEVTTLNFEDNRQYLKIYNNKMRGLIILPPDISPAEKNSDNIILARQQMIYLLTYANPNFSLDVITNCMEGVMEELSTNPAADQYLQNLQQFPNDLEKIFDLIKFIYELQSTGLKSRTIRETSLDQNSTVKPAISANKTLIQTTSSNLIFDPVPPTPKFCQDFSELFTSVIYIFDREHNITLSRIPVREMKTDNFAFAINLIEKNAQSYLSVGDMALPGMYFTYAFIYQLLSIMWLIYLCVSRNKVYKLHFLMFTVIWTKSLSSFFQAIDFYILGKYGYHQQGWSIMFYITHLIRGALFFTTILLVGAGWVFIKHMLTKRERYIFLIVVPLQIIANIATIVIDESEEGSVRYATWREIFIFFDLVCCGAILFPVLWSIKHLQTASQIDGKAALNLQKLRLFRQFYIMVISYVYLTRIIAYLLRITVHYNLAWTVEFFKEMITMLFMVAVGIKFRPTEDNPYLRVPNDEDDDDEDTLLERYQLDSVKSQSGFTDGVTRVSTTGDRPISYSQPPATLSLNESTDFSLYEIDEDINADDILRMPLMPGSGRLKNPNKIS